MSIVAMIVKALSMGIFTALTVLALVGRASLPKSRASLRFWLLMFALSFSLIAISGLSNFAVRLANGGKMPVLTLDVGDSPKHCVLTEKSRFPMLADRICIPIPPAWGRGRASIGDIVMTVGILGMLICWGMFLRVSKSLDPPPGVSKNDEV